MKGSMETDTIVTVAIMILLIAILVIIAVFYILGYYLPEVSSRSYITQRCSEWVKEGCTQRSAEPPDGIRIEVEGETKYLAQLCVAYYGGDESNWQSEFSNNPKYYESCKKLCMGCLE